MKAFKRHLNYFHRLYIMLAVVIIARYAAPAALQGASSQVGQEIYAYFDKFAKIMEWLAWAA